MTLENSEENYIYIYICVCVCVYIYIYVYIKVSASAQIIYHCSISPESILSIIIYILFIGRSYGIVGIEILTNMYTYDKTTLISMNPMNPEGVPVNLTYN